MATRRLRGEGRLGIACWGKEDRVASLRTCETPEVLSVMVGLDVGEHGARPDIQDGVNARGKGERGHQHLVPRPTREALQDQVQRRGPGADRDGMGDPRLFRDAMLELLDPGTERQAPGAQDLGDDLDVGLIDIGRRHRDRRPRDQGIRAHRTPRRRAAAGRSGAPATPCGCSV